MLRKCIDGYVRDKKMKILNSRVNCLTAFRSDRFSLFRTTATQNTFYWIINLDYTGIFSYMYIVHVFWVVSTPSKSILIFCLFLYCMLEMFTSLNRHRFTNWHVFNRSSIQYIEISVCVCVRESASLSWAPSAFNAIKHNGMKIILLFGAITRKVCANFNFDWWIWWLIRSDRCEILVKRLKTTQFKHLLMVSVVCVCARVAVKLSCIYKVSEFNFVLHFHSFRHIWADFNWHGLQVVILEHISSVISNTLQMAHTEWKRFKTFHRQLIEFPT